MQVCKNLNVSEYLSLRKLPLFLKMHINGCADCQSAVIEYSENNRISDSVFGKPFESQKKLWLGAEYGDSNEADKKSPRRSSKSVEDNDIETFMEGFSSQGIGFRFFLFCSRNKKWILSIGYLALLIPLLQIAFQLF